ncbi:MAG: L-2-amino-thiazoline-4-carboxylic acid hydrolase [Clostridia bacterium]
MNKILEVKIKISAFKVLKKEVNFKELIQVLKEMERSKKRGEPWLKFPECETEKDLESRELIGEAILLYRALKNIREIKEAERIVREVIIRSAVTQLNFLIPLIKREKLLKMGEEDRSAFFEGIIDKFPNADYELVEENSKRYKFDIVRCRLVDLIIKAGHPELMDAFCAGDGIYFSMCQPEVLFSRQHMIGKGAEKCDFEFRIKD